MLQRRFSGPYRPLSRIPENTLKFFVGVLLSAFGTFWVGEGLGFSWPGQDWSMAVRS
jgi:Ca2+/H+ antiporter, TMEM165/GDT1 family